MFQDPSPLQPISHPLLDQHHIKLLIKRDDLIHPDVSGNKWRKLKYNIEAFRRSGKNEILTFGGAYSNHIAATAAACSYLKIPCVGIIRGEELHVHSNPTLAYAHKMGMQLTFASREDYRWYRDAPEQIQKSYPDAYVIPEGGANNEGIRGVQEIRSEMPDYFDIMFTAVGTGTTLAGIATSLQPTEKAIGVQVLKGDFLHADIRQKLAAQGHKMDNWQLATDYHFGGYARTTDHLIQFINRMGVEISLNLDPIYTGKAFFAVWQMIDQGKFDHKTLIFLHTGGLQGVAGFNQKSTQKIQI